MFGWFARERFSVMLAPPSAAALRMQGSVYLAGLFVEQQGWAHSKKYSLSVIEGRPLTHDLHFALQIGRIGEDIPAASIDVLRSLTKQERENLRCEFLSFYKDEATGFHTRKPIPTEKERLAFYRRVVIKLLDTKRLEAKLASGQPVRPGLPASAFPDAERRAARHVPQ